MDRKSFLSLVDYANGNPNLEYLRLEFIYNLEQRKIVTSYEGHWPFSSEQDEHKAIRAFFDELVGTPEKLMEFAKTGQLNKATLTALLESRIRKHFLTICGHLEKQATERCGSSGDTCLVDGCAFEGTDEVCLNAVLLSEGKCLRSCIDIWVDKFQNPENRIEVWRR